MNPGVASLEEGTGPGRAWARPFPGAGKEAGGIFHRDVTQGTMDTADVPAFSNHDEMGWHLSLLGSPQGEEMR